MNGKAIIFAYSLTNGKVDKKSSRGSARVAPP